METRIIQQKETVKNWVLSELKDHQDYEDRPCGWLKEIVQHGCQSGIVGALIYYHDTVAFYDKHEKEIWDRLENEYQEFGFKTPLEMVASFNGGERIGGQTQFKNLLAWWIVEETARDILRENGEDY